MNGSSPALSFRTRGTPGHPLLLRNSPCEYIPVRSTAASMRPTVLQAYAGELPYLIWNTGLRPGFFMAVLRELGCPCLWERPFPVPPRPAPARRA